MQQHSMESIRNFANFSNTEVDAQAERFNEDLKSTITYVKKAKLEAS